MASPAEQFAPGANHQRLDCTAASASASLPGGPGNAVYIYNFGPNLASVVIGTGAQTATISGASGTPAAGFVVPPSRSVCISIPAGADNIAGICLATQTAQLWINRGVGLKP